MKRKIEQEILDAMHQNPDNWKGMLYFNRKDPRIFVPKFYPALGWTVNLGNAYSYLTLVGLALIITLFSRIL